MATNQLLLQLWEINQSKFQTLLSMVTDANLKYRLDPTTATVGHMSCHTAEAQLFLAKLFLYLDMPSFVSKARGVDAGNEYSLEEINDLAKQGRDLISKSILKMPAHKWFEEIEVKHFGKITPFKGLALMMNHTAHHCGQIEQAVKKGKI